MQIQINRQKLVIFLRTNNEQSEKEIEETILFRIKCVKISF